MRATPWLFFGKIAATGQSLALTGRLVLWGGLLGLALAMRWSGMSAALWYDEAFSASLAQLPLPNLLAATFYDVHPPGYYLLLWILVSVTGSASEMVLRLPSLIAGLLLIPVVYRLGLAHLPPHRGEWMGLLAAALTAVSPFMIFYSNEARSYSLLMLAVALAALGLAEERFWLFALGSLAALYLHNLGAVFVVSLVLCYLPFVIRHSPLRLFASSLFALPALAWTVLQAGHVAGNYWIPPLNHPGRLIATLDDLFWFSPDNPFVLATGLLTAAVIVFTIYDLRFTIACLLPYSPTPYSLLPTPYSLLFTPLALLSLTSLLWQPILISRSLAGAAPFFILLIAQTVSRTRYRAIFFMALGLPTLALVLLAAPGRAPLDNDLLNLYGHFRPGAALYHASPGSYLLWRYYRPDIPQFLWPDDSPGLSKTLSRETRLAMGLNEIDFDLIKCARIPTPYSLLPTSYFLLYFHNPTTSAAEMEAVSQIIQQDGGQKIRQIRDDSTVNAALVRLNPKCKP